MAQLFEKFEVNSDPRWQVITRLVGASLVLHLALVWMVIYVPAFRDTLNIVALVAGTKFVDKAYDPTRLADDVQWVQAGEKFHYPQGYFQPGGRLGVELPPENMYSSDVAAAFAPKIISLASSEKNVPPGASPSPSPETTPSPAASPAASASPSAVAQASPASSPLTPEQAQDQLDKVAAENKVTLPDETQINKKPLKDFATYANDQKNQGKLDLDKPFEVVIEAQLDENGKLKNPVVTGSGDKNLVDLFLKMVGAVNDSGFLIYLQPISKDNPGATVKITVKQGEKEVLASVESEASSAQRAETVAKTLNNLLYFGAESRAGKDEEVLMKNTNAAPDGKRVVVNFSMSRQSIVDMIKKQLEPGV
jgi:hypothetical protein